MTSVERKEHIATWNGDATLWLDYVKRVRLQYERTEPKKRCLLGAELASRLTGKAWDVASAEIDHSKLQQSNGASYLLSFLEARLCKTPVPDVGQQSRELISRASNAKTRRKTTFLPGDLVYFKRIKPPAQPQSHLRLGADHGARRF